MMETERKTVRETKGESLFFTRVRSSLIIRNQMRSSLANEVSGGEISQLRVREKKREVESWWEKKRPRFSLIHFRIVSLERLTMILYTLYANSSRPLIYAHSSMAA